MESIGDKEDAVMKQLKRPTKKQSIRIKSRRLDPNKWLVERDTSESMMIVHRESGRRRIIYKEF